GGTLFNAEFGIRHRAAPYRKGQVLHSVFAAAMFPLTSSRIDSLVARTHYSCNKLNHILGYVPSRDITKEISEVILDKEGRR
ncbi:hypothetical protein ACRCP3_27395, partial [Pseudomonas aeruginosa]